MNTNFNPLPADIELIGKEIVDICFQLHVHLGPGLLESVYEKCFIHELFLRNIPYKTQVSVPVVYKGLIEMNALRLDLLIADKVIVELKAQEYTSPVWEAQLLSYLKMKQCRLGYLINFAVPQMKQGIKRMVL